METWNKSTTANSGYQLLLVFLELYLFLHENILS